MKNNKGLQYICFHCNKNLCCDKLCNNCRYDKNIMITATEMKKIYKISEDDLDKNKIYHEKFKTKYESYGTSYYLPDLHEYIKNVLINNKENPKYLLLNKVKEIFDKKENEKENDKKVYDFVIEGINKNLSKYNIQKNFIENKIMKELIENKVLDLINSFSHNIDQFIILSLEFIETYHNKKNEIDSKINETVEPEFQTNAKEYKCYEDYIFRNKNLNECMEIILKEQEKIIYKNDRDENIKKFILDFEKEFGYSSKKYLGYYKKIVEQYVIENTIKYDFCINKIRKIVCDKYKSDKLVKISNRLQKYTNRDFYQDLEQKYKNFKIRNANTFEDKLNNDEKEIIKNHEILIEKLKFLLNEYDEIKNYIYSFMDNKEKIICDDPVIDMDFLISKNDNISNKISECIINNNNIEKEIKEIKLELEEIKKYVNEHKEKYNFPQELINYCKKFNLFTNIKIINYIKKQFVNKPLSGSDMIKDIKKYYFTKCLYTKNKFNFEKEQFVKTELFEKYLEDDELDLDYVMAIYEKYRKK
jgi:hypothetical protein